MTALYVIQTTPYKTATASETKERAEEIIKNTMFILDSQKPFWKQRILELFKKYVEDSKLTPDELANSKRGGLYWKFHKILFVNMCLAYNSD